MVLVEGERGINHEAHFKAVQTVLKPSRLY